MSGEQETAPLMDTIEVNEMHVKVQGGPRHYVLTVVPAGATERWRVDHRDVIVSNNEVVGFVHDADAEHFISQGRAERLGRWTNEAELRAAWAAHVAKHRQEVASVDADSEPGVVDAEAAPKRRGKPPGSKNREQGA